MNRIFSLLSGGGGALASLLFDSPIHTQYPHRQPRLRQLHPRAITGRILSIFPPQRPDYGRTFGVNKMFGKLFLIHWRGL